MQRRGMQLRATSSAFEHTVLFLSSAECSVTVCRHFGFKLARLWYEATFDYDEGAIHPF